MAIQLTKTEKRWLKQVFFCLINSPNPKDSSWSDADFNTYAAGHMKLASNRSDSSSTIESIWQAAQDIMQELEDRTFRDIDDKISTVANVTAYFDKDTSSYVFPRGSAEARRIANNALAKMCVLNGVAWDPNKYTSYEVDYFYRTEFGKTLKATWDEELGVAADSDPAASNQNTSSGQPVQQKPTTTVPGANPNDPRANIVAAGNYVKPNSVHQRPTKTKTPGVVQSTYKQSGPQSMNAFDLKSIPGQKVNMPGDNGNLYVITGTDSVTSKNRPLAYINPLINTKTYRNGTTNRIKFGSAHGYSDLTLYFNTANEAYTFLLKMEQAGLIPAKIVNPCVGHRSISSIAKQYSHGFYEIGTELGNAMVCAYNLNENYKADVTEPLEEEVIMDSVEPVQKTKTKEEYLEELKDNIRKLTNWD